MTVADDVTRVRRPRAQLVADAVVAAYINDISGRPPVPAGRAHRVRRRKLPDRACRVARRPQ